MGERTHQDAGAPAQDAAAVSGTTGPTVAASVLLAGGLTLSPLSAACGRPVLDLHVDDESTVLQVWSRRLDELVRAGLASPTLRVVAKDKEWAPAAPAGNMDVQLQIETEPQPYRGPAGVARDVCGGYAPDDLILLAEAARLPDVNLAELIERHTARQADVTVGVNEDRSPAGVYVLRRRALDLVPTIGFMDLKEQWLARVVGAGMHVRVHRFTTSGTRPLRTREQFLAATEQRQREHLSPAFVPDARGFVSSRAKLAPDAFVRGAAIMPGASVGPGAVVVRSIILPGASVPAGASVIDQVVAARPAAASSRRR